MFTLTTFNGSLWVLGSRWSWSRLVLVGTELLFLFGSLQFLLVVRLLLNVQLLLDLMRSTASIRRHWRAGVGLLDSIGENPRRCRRGPGW